MRIVSIVVDEDPRRPAFAQHAKNLAQAARRIRPVVSRLDRNRSCEEIRVPGNFVHAADDEHRVLQRDAVPSPAPQPTSRTLSSEDNCIRSSTGRVIGRWSSSISSPRPATAQRLNSSRSAWLSSGSAIVVGYPGRNSARLLPHVSGGFGSTGFSLCAFPLAQTQTTQTEVCATCGYCSIFARSSTNFCWRWDWSLPSSDSACCVMFIEQNFGPHIEQNFASL